MIHLSMQVCMPFLVLTRARSATTSPNVIPGISSMCSSMNQKQCMHVSIASIANTYADLQLVVNHPIDVINTLCMRSRQLLEHNMNIAELE
jgi:hypothetical protein